MSRQIKVATNGELLEGESLQTPEEDMVNSPYHYQSYNKELNIECIDAMRAAFGDAVVSAFCICNVFKYTWRHQSKNGKQDLEKAQWYLNYLINYMETTEK